MVKIKWSESAKKDLKDAFLGKKKSLEQRLKYWRASPRINPIRSLRGHLKS